MQICNDMIEMYIHSLMTMDGGVCKNSFICCESISHLENGQGNLPVRAMDFIMREVWIHRIPMFLTVDEALQLRVLSNMFNNDHICGEYGPLLLFLSRNHDDFSITSNRSETNLLKERSGNTLL